jgi:zinc protease
MLNFRFSEITSDPDAEVLNAGSFRTRLVRSTGVSALNALVTNDNIVPGMQRLVTEGRRIKEHGFNPSELERAKSAVLSSYESSYQERDTTNSRSFASEYTRNFLENEAAPGIDREYRLAQTLLPGIGIEEVNAIAEEYLKTENRVVLVSAVENEGFTLPSQDALAAALEEAETRTVQPYEDRGTTGPLMSDAPEPGAITEERRIEDLDAVEWQLENGARVVAKQTEFKSDEILVRAFAPGGTSVVTEEEHLSARFASEIMRESGVADFNRTDLQSILSDKSVSLEPFVTELQNGFSGSSSVDDLEVLGQLIHLSMSEPRRDEQAFQAWRQRKRATLENRNQQPQRVFVDRLQEILSQDHPRRQPVTAERLDEVSLEEAFTFYEERFTDASDFTFVFSGNFEEQDLRELVRRYIATLPAEPDSESFGDIGVTRPQDTVEESVSSGIAPQSLVGIVYHDSYEWDPQTNYEIRSLGRLLQLRLRETLREEQGGTYGVSAFAATSRFPKERYLFYIYFGTSPDRAEELSDTAHEIIADIKSSPPESSLVERVKAGQQSSYETDRETNEYWLQAIADLYWHDVSPEVILRYPERVDGLDAETLQQTAQAYFNEDQYVQVILYPEGEGPGSNGE